MALQVVTNINVDFHNKKYTLINAKQYDSGSRWITITCYDNGNIFNLSANKHSAYIRYKKADGHAVLNQCRINYRGEVLVELTEQMLAASGFCYVDLLVINKGSAMVNINTGEIIAIDDTPILSTMAFYIDVHEASVDNSEIESSYEFDALNDLMQKAEAEYSEVIRLSKSYAIGDANGIRDNEDTDNSKYYCEQTAINAGKAAISEANAKESEEAIVDYYEKIKNIANGLDSGFIPIGTISFSELAKAEKATGFVYNIRDDFVTNSSFAEGAGMTYTAGTNVYCRSDGLWDCFGGSAPSAATVAEVKSYLGI